MGVTLTQDFALGFICGLGFCIILAFTYAFGKDGMP